jgi:ABC-type transport system substrate-binding protein
MKATRKPTRKRLGLISFAAAVALTLGACSSSSSDDTGATSETTAAAEGTEATAETTVAAEGTDTAVTEAAAPGTEAAPAVAAEGDAVKGGRLKVGLEEDFDYWDGTSYYGDQWSWNWTMFRPLLSYASTADAVKQNEMMPAVAESFEASADQTKFTFKIRKGLKFGDGSPVTATDVKATYEYMLDPASGFYDGPLGSGYYNVLVGFDEYTKTEKKGEDKVPAADRAKEISGIKVIDESTVEFTTTKPNPAFVRATAMGWAYIRKAGVPHRHLKPEELTTIQAVGPYKFVGYTPKKSVTIEREPMWKDNVAAGMPEDKNENNIDGFDISIGLPSDVQLQDIKSGKLDISYDAPKGSDIEAVASDATFGKRFFSDPDAAIDYLVFKHDLPPFKDNLKLRQAVAKAVDRPAIASIMGGPKVRKPWAQTLSGNLMAGDTTQPYSIEGADADAAKALVAESGVKDPAITLVHFSDEPAPAVAASVKEDLEAVGFKVTLKSIARSAFYGFLSDPKSEYNLALPGWGQDYPDAITYFGPLMGCNSIGGGTNYGQFCDKAFDAKVAAADALPNGPDRDKAWAALAQETAKDYLPYTAVMLRIHPSFVSERFGGHVWTTARHHVWSSYYVKDGK